MKSAFSRTRVFGAKIGEALDSKFRMLANRFSKTLSSHARQPYFDTLALGVSNNSCGYFDISSYNEL